MTPYLPITPEQIARDAIDAAEAGASIIDLHADARPGRVHVAAAKQRLRQVVPSSLGALHRLPSARPQLRRFPVEG